MVMNVLWVNDGGFLWVDQEEDEGVRSVLALLQWVHSERKTRKVEIGL
jgi:hypothetical protein